MNKFSERLKELRVEKNISQTKLANAMKVGQSCVSGWEKQWREPNFNALIKLAKYFEVTTDYLLGLED